MTALTRWDPFQELVSWPRSFFGRDLFAGLRPDGGLSVEWAPRCDVTEEDDAIVVHAELPGVDAKDIEVAIEGSRLTVRGEKRSEKDEEKGDGKRTYSERFFGSFERTITIPEGTDPAAVEATMKDGVLNVRVPRPKAVKPESRKIEIKST